MRGRSLTIIPNNRLFYLVTVMTLLGVVIVADVSAPQALNVFSDKFFFAKQQAVWALVGFIFLIIGSKIPYRFWLKISLPLFIISLVPLLIVLIPAVGSKFLGARRWLILGPISIQPAELIKLTLSIYLSSIAMSKKKMLSYLFPIALCAGLVMLQPDLGTTLVIVTLAMFQFFASGVNLIKFAFVGLVSAIFGLLTVMISNYRRERLMGFIEALKNPLDSSYHIKQVLLALGAGGIWGVGFGASRQKYLFLPEAVGDSIFSVIAEELGFLVASVVILSFVYFIILGFKISKNAPDTFSKILAVGITSWIGGQAFLNIGSMVSLVPITGVPLPFFSYGGSSLVTVMFAVGILLNIASFGKEGYEKRR